jgi:uncharacterized membrane protein YphA (DoxX/SURF4 family)
MNTREGDQAIAELTSNNRVHQSGQRELVRIDLGRHAFGLTAILIAILTLLWREFDIWQDLGAISHRAILVYFAAALEILGGLAIQWPRTARFGAVVLGGISFVFLLFCIPPIVHQPLVYNNWYGFFEVLSQVAGALIVFTTVAHSDSSRPPRIARVAYLFFGLCVVYYTLGQAFDLSATASLVPKWIPPGRMFWAIATTIAFALAAIALLSGRFALLASRLLTAMLIGFALLVWLPALISNRHSLSNWTEAAQTVAIAAAAWIVADFLARYRRDRKNPGLSENAL